MNLKINKYDNGNMIDSLLGFSKQISNSLNLMNNINFTYKQEFNNIIVCGMGGSAIGADVVRSILKNKLKIPLYINRDYSLPKWANKQSCTRRPHTRGSD